MMLASSTSVSIAMSSGNRPQRFKLSLPFLHKKKKRQNLLHNNPVAEEEPVDDSELPEPGLGDALQDIAEENEEHQQHPHPQQPQHQHHRDARNGRTLHSADEDGLENDGATQAEDNDDENLTIALVPKYLPPIQLQNIKSPVTFKTYDIGFPPSALSPSRRKSKTSSPRGFDHPSTSGALSAPHMTTGVGCKSWLKTRCGYGSCSKQIDSEKNLHRGERQGHSERAGHSHSRRRSSSRAKSADPSSWERESEWSVLAEVENEVVKKRVILRKKRGHKKSSKLAPSPGFSPTQCVRASTPDVKCSLRDPYEEVREAAKYDSPAQRPDHLRAVELDCSGGSHLLTTSTDVEANSHEERIRPWERSFSSPSSDDELFTTSFEVEGGGAGGGAGPGKPRKKKWTSNSSDETEGRQRRTGSHARSKSTWSRDSTRTVVEEEDVVEIQKSRAKKGGSRIIFLSTPPRPKELGIDEDDDQQQLQLQPQPGPGSVVKCSSDRYGDYCKLESVTKEPRFDKSFPTTTGSAYKASVPPTVFEGDLEANAKAWSKIDLRAIRGGDPNDASIRELPMVSRTKEPRHIDVHIEDQICNLRLESDVSDSSQGKSYSSRGSRRHAKALPTSKSSLDQEKPSKKKRGTNSRRRKGRRSKAPPPLLPNDLHGKVKESVAVVKSSYDPYTDFRDSMVEMIVEKEIQGAGDLEELLRCYLSLNSAEYHSVIVKVFADVWRELFADNL
ncbi:hypothetical protein Mapa_009549 [Marchantia paleacea]|nr:hypothetical protein Mapa_009549 [Marchantia paleacea]